MTEFFDFSNLIPRPQYQHRLGYKPMCLFLQLKTACHNAFILKNITRSRLNLFNIGIFISTLSGLFNEIKGNFGNQSEGQITPKSFPYGRLSLAMSLRFGFGLS